MIKPAGPEAQRVKRVYAVVDNLNVRSATDVLLFALAHPRWTSCSELTPPSERHWFIRRRFFRTEPGL
jgi:hypothetical protein